MKRLLLYCVLLCAMPLASLAQPHRIFDELLKKHVDANGKVNYKGFRQDMALLDEYCLQLGNNQPADSWTNGEKMAYWINAYNAFTIRLIAENYPVTSIMQLDGGKTWDVRRISLGNRKYSLNEIENDMLRMQFRDPRVHFVINCAAKGCPPLWNKAVTPANLEMALEERTSAFINNPKHNTLNADGARVSKIFEWYAADFGDLKSFLSRFSGIRFRKDAVLTYREYDWSLNDTP